MGIHRLSGVHYALLIIFDRMLGATYGNDVSVTSILVNKNDDMTYFYKELQPSLEQRKTTFLG